MTTSTATQRRPSTTGVGERKELASYTVAGHARILYGQRVDGIVRITDCPADGHGRRYLVERGLEQDGYAALTALVNDYVAQAAKHCAIPAADNPVERYLKALS